MGLIGDMTGMENIYSIAYSRGFEKSEVEKSINWIVNLLVWEKLSIEQ